jgi:hypothetical protein
MKSGEFEMGGEERREWAYQLHEADVVGLGGLAELQVLPDEHADPDAAQVEGVQEVVHCPPSTDRPATT